MADSYTFMAFEVFPPDSQGDYHWHVSEYEDGMGAVVEYRERGRDKVTGDTIDICADPDTIDRIADALKRIAQEQRNRKG